MDITEANTDTEPVPEMAQPSDEDCHHFRYVLWSQAAQDRRSRRTGIERQKPVPDAVPDAVSAADAPTGGRQPR